jgi:hypothetical protein
MAQLAKNQLERVAQVIIVIHDEDPSFVHHPLF